MKAVIVLGMHRSATSMTARALHKSGEVHMGKNLMLGIPSNPEGHYENYDFFHLNNEILWKAGGDWHKPPSHEQIMALEPIFRDKIKKTIEASIQNAKNGGFKSWGWKDPRTVLTIDLYIPYLDKPQFVTCFRDHGEVALSLSSHEGVTYDEAYQLSIIYNKRLIEFIKKYQNI
jgi:hypothetical protein